MYNESLIGDGWSTGLNNKILRVGPGFTDGGKIRLRVNNELRYVTSKNVVGECVYRPMLSLLVPLNLTTRHSSRCTKRMNLLVILC